MSKTHTFKVHDESVNTYGFRMLTSGADLTEYEKNPVVLYNHNDWEAPIGRAERVYAKDDAIYADILFDTADPRRQRLPARWSADFCVQPRWVLGLPRRRRRTSFPNFPVRPARQ